MSEIKSAGEPSPAFQSAGEPAPAAQMLSHPFALDLNMSGVTVAASSLHTQSPTVLGSLPWTRAHERAFAPPHLQDGLYLVRNISLRLITAVQVQYGNWHAPFLIEEYAYLGSIPSEYTLARY